MDSESSRKLDQLLQDSAATRADVRNLKEYVQAVSSNVKDVRQDLSDHKESVEAHGRKAVDGFLGYVSLAVAVLVGIVELVRGKGHQ